MASSFLTLRDVAKLLQLSEKSVYRLAQAGKIPGFKAGGTWRFRREDVDGWVDAQIRASRRSKARS